MALYSKGSNNGWNDFLTECVVNMDINRLAKMSYQIQAGMEDLAKLKLNSDEIIVWYIRLLKSLEKTAKNIVRIKYPLPKIEPNEPQKSKAALEAKRSRDRELAEFFRKSAY